MDSVCSEQHKFLLTKKAMSEIDIPPRKLLGRRSSGEMFADEAEMLQKYLPYNNGGEDDDSDPYSSDHFRMYEFKVRRCTRSRSHDWTDCPFAHPGEKARRRDPRRYHYSGTVCADFRRGSCPRGDNCEFAHGVFECWLHPARYRTEACKDGKNCKRKVCFFAHSPRQLRVLPPSSDTTSPPMNSPISAERKYRNSNSNHCCVFCCHPGAAASSPTSTLMGISHLSPPISPSFSPPLSPMKTRSASGLSSTSRFSDRAATMESCGLTEFNQCGLSYKDVLTELMSSLESMNVNEASHLPARSRSLDLPWVDVNFSCGDDQPQFLLSPSAPSPSGSRDAFDTTAGNGGYYCPSNSFGDDKIIDNGSACPDLGWVNDLLT
ncbi:hypothetical protein NMG60_11035632 [Bertholletia excelsa]